MKQRNPEATCRTCPYSYVNEDGILFNCMRFPKVALPSHSFPTWGWEWPSASEDEYCGEHPDFFLDEGYQQPRFQFITHHTDRTCKGCGATIIPGAGHTWDSENGWFHCQDCKGMPLDEPEEKKPTPTFEVDDVTKAHIESLNRQYERRMENMKRGIFL